MQAIHSKLALLLLLLLLLPAAAMADILGGRVGANAWSQVFDGAAASGGESVDLEDDLGYDDDTGNGFYFQFEHPVPLLPNVMLAHTDIDVSAGGRLEGVEFDGITYTGEVGSSIDISHTDATFYYEILDNWVNLDIGLTGRYFPEGLAISDVGTGLTGRLELDYVIPMAYAEVRFDLPLSGLALGVAGNGIGYDGDSFYDLSAKAAYTFAFGLGLELGYRVFDLDYKDDDESVDVTIDGVFAGVFWDF